MGHAPRGERQTDLSSDMPPIDGMACNLGKQTRQQHQIPSEDRIRREFEYRKLVRRVEQLRLHVEFVRVPDAALIVRVDRLSCKKIYERVSSTNKQTSAM